MRYEAWILIVSLYIYHIICTDTSLIVVGGKYLSSGCEITVIWSLSLYVWKENSLFRHNFSRIYVWEFPYVSFSAGFMFFSTLAVFQLRCSVIIWRIRLLFNQPTVYIDRVTTAAADVLPSLHTDVDEEWMLLVSWSIIKDEIRSYTEVKSCQCPCTCRCIHLRTQFTTHNSKV